MDHPIHAAYGNSFAHRHLGLHRYHQDPDDCQERNMGNAARGAAWTSACYWCCCSCRYREQERYAGRAQIAMNYGMLRSGIRHYYEALEEAVVVPSWTLRIVSNSYS